MSTEPPGVVTRKLLLRRATFAQFPRINPPTNLRGAPVSPSINAPTPLCRIKSSAHLGVFASFAAGRRMPHQRSGPSVQALAIDDANSGR